MKARVANLKYMKEGERIEKESIIHVYDKLKVLEGT